MKRVDRLSRSSSAAAACRRFRRCWSRRRTSASASLALCWGVSICSVRLANVGPSDSAVRRPRKTRTPRLSSCDHFGSQSAKEVLVCRHALKGPATID